MTDFATWADKLAIRENTIVIIATDNGTESRLTARFRRGACGPSSLTVKPGSGPLYFR